MRMIKSAILSATTVPKLFSKGTFSYFVNTSALETSPDLGMARFIKYATPTAIKLFA